MNKAALGKAVKILGGQTQLAKAIGVSQGRVWQWLNGQGDIPAERCADIERATNGAVTRSDLRPDLWEPAGKSAKKAA